MSESSNRIKVLESLLLLKEIENQYLKKQIQSLTLEQVPSKTSKKPHVDFIIHDPIPSSGAPDLENVIDKSNFFFGKRVVITGVFNSFSRDFLSELLHERGAFRTGSISTKTDVVIIGLEAGPSKLEKVEELKQTGHAITCLSEDEVKQLL